jgi:beta-glucosidase
MHSEACYSISYAGREYMKHYASAPRVRGCWLAICLLACYPARPTHQPAGKRLLPSQRPALPIEKRVDDLVARMTLEEKASQMVNAARPSSGWAFRLMTGGTRRCTAWRAPVTATVFPQAIGMAATWDEDLMHKSAMWLRPKRAPSITNSRARMTEAATRADLLESEHQHLRDPRWGRGQETYGEDPI